MSEKGVGYGLIDCFWWWNNGRGYHRDVPDGIGNIAGQREV